MVTPVRLRLSRAKGFNLQSASAAVNGLPAVKVDRSTRWGNPFRVGDPGVPDAKTAVARYREWLATTLSGLHTKRLARERLRGRNLGCWCAPGAPCHADVLIKVANE